MERPVLFEAVNIRVTPPGGKRLRVTRFAFVRYSGYYSAGRSIWKDLSLPMDSGENHPPSALMPPITRSFHGFAE
jgi:hypothetical protein